MAKNYKTKGNNKWIAVAVGFLVVVLAIVYTITSLVTGSWNPTAWAKRDTTPPAAQVPEPDDTDNNTGAGGEEVNDFTGAVISNDKSNGVRLLSAKIPREAYAAMGVSEDAETAYTITAEVLPSYALDKTLEWSVDFEDSDSEWASGKTVTDYVTVSAREENTALLECLAAFGEPIILTATSVSNPEVSARCHIDYYKRITDINFAFFYDGEEVTPTIENDVYKLDYTGEQKNYSVELRPEYSAGTLLDTYTNDLRFQFTNSFGYSMPTNTQLTLDDIKIPAGLSEGEPPMSENAERWCEYFFRTIFDYDMDDRNYLEYANAGTRLVRGIDINFFGSHIYPEVVLTEEEQLHPRCAYYLSILPTTNSSGFFENLTDWQERKELFENYTPSGYNYCGVGIISYLDFVNAVRSCDDAEQGIFQFGAQMRGGYSTFQKIIQIGYKDISVVNVSDINLSDTNIAF